jgi:DNA-binding YbaB/EbfC family protein
MGSGYAKMKKQRRAMEEQFSKMQEEMQKAEHEGVAGNGLVRIVLTGEKKVKSIKIDPKCVDPTDVEGLEDLIVAAYGNAYEKSEASSPVNPDLFSL